MITETIKEKYEVFKYLSLILPCSFAKKISGQFKPSVEVIKAKKTLLKNTMTYEDIERRLSNMKRLTMGITHDCNLRCTYCVYGGKYPEHLIHNSSYMVLETLKKAIDLFLSYVNSPSRTTRIDIYLGFYGGEPLLQFDNILKAFDYARERIKEVPIKRNLRGMITTNGVLLDHLRVHELLERDFMISISLDGPKDQHDKCRVKADRSGSFDDILANINHLKNNYPHKYETIRYILTYHPSNDLKKTEEFFLSNPELFNERNVIIIPVEMENISDYYKKEWYFSKVKQNEQISHDLDKDKWFYEKVLFSWMEKLYKNATQFLVFANDFTGSCFPGVENVFIKADGSIHICEKMNFHFPIGNVYTGFDMEAILRIINNWHKYILKRKCWDCEAWWLCTHCFSTEIKDKSIQINEKDCQRFLEATQLSISSFLNYMERKNENKNINRYSSIDSYLESL
ncbi:MAG: uncharacterized protein QG657_4143 [Acidobacteriota bacterium]|nr:uncharacterized protein [Acidobacteriota bacterium]